MNAATFIDDMRRQLAQSQQRMQTSVQTILDATSKLSQWYWDMQQQQLSVTDLLDNHRVAREKRKQLQSDLTSWRKQTGELEKGLHRFELELNQIQLERRERWPLEFAKITTSIWACCLKISKRTLKFRERKSTKRSIRCEGRSATLERSTWRHSKRSRSWKNDTIRSSQYQDLVDAKDALAKIINKISMSSRRLFTETLEAIRTGFQALFRRVFGGGHADIVLEEGVDILEAGIEIIATPPGKHSLGISLLSGGERLTAVTLLMAIFQYRPSPFCVLDEVDGPLDEANIGRFTDVLKEFLQWTKVVVVTHSKDHDRGHHVVWRDHAGIGRLETRVRSL
ncbi:MAG: hypothetical protein R3C28_15120 [Pirellulaceae bacterium]